MKDRQRKKFDRLMLSKRQRQRETLGKDRLVVNLSSQQLTEAQHDVLALGLNFRYSTKEDTSGRHHCQNRTDCQKAE